MKKIIIFSLCFSMLAGILLLGIYFSGSWMLIDKRDSNIINQDVYTNENKLRRAAEQGDMVAQNELGVLYEKAKNHTKSAYWYNKSAEKGYSLAQYNIGVAYENGRGVSKNYQKANDWYRKAAIQGYSKAAFNLGMLYFEGKGVPQDYRKSREWFMQAAENNTMAMYAMGRIYYYGLGVPKDDRQAIVWYQKGVDLGSMRARNSLALLYSQGGDGFYKDRVKALSLLIASACQGYVVAQNNLGVLYSDGAEDVIADHKKAYAWFSVAASNGLEEAIKSQRNIAEKMSTQELEQAKNIAIKYIEKYPSPINEDDTYKSNTECKYP
ncbi:sel1 repeat family protein [Salmonella enterica subsp. houtenae]|nr:sel1 repeat family protein [Salmonella enterica subsp. houtenae]